MSSEQGYGDPHTRRRILDATRELVEAAGAGVRLADVASRAGVSRQAVYLHFGDRARLMLALVDDIDERAGAAGVRADILGQPTGVDALRRWVEVLSRYTATIDRVAEVLERATGQDEALAAAWRDRMGRRQMMARAIVARIAQEGDLHPAWSQADAAELAYAVTMPGPWRELTHELGWDTRRYSVRVFGLLAGSLLGDSARRRALDTV